MNYREYKPLVSIITVCYDSESTIEKTIKSVINQTYHRVEYIIVDGNSKDKTVSIIEKYKKANNNIRYISEPDSGIYDAMNKGIKMSKGDIIGIINSDDWYEYNAIEKIVVKFLEMDIDAIHADMNIWKRNSVIFVAKGRNDLKMLKKGMILNHPTVFLKKSVYQKYGYFNTKYKIAADWDLLVRVWMNKSRIFYMEDIISNFRLGGESYNFNKNTIIEKHEIRKSYRLYKYLDVFYIFDLIKCYIVPKSAVLKLSLLKTKFLNGKW